MTSPGTNDEQEFGPETDRAALVALYEATGGDGWFSRDGWLGDGPVGTWWGVSTDAVGRVEELDLGFNGLSGEIPRELGKLTQLTELGLHANQLSGEIPRELGKLTQLTELGLHANQLSGEIPRELGKLTQLTELGLHANQLSGEIPRELGKLTQLTELGLHANQLSGEIPRELGKLTQLTELGLHANQLSGEIPRELGKLTQLTELGLHANELSGEIPRELGDLTQLTRLGLGQNELSGEIPRELGKLTQLTRLGLGQNELSGEIPRELGDLTQLTGLGLYQNQLSGEIPRELGELTQLTELELDANELSGEIPCELGKLTQLTRLGLGQNELSAEIPRELGELTQLTGLWLHENQLSGEIPREFGDLTQLYALWLFQNQLSGEIPRELGNLTQLTGLWLFQNQLGGEIPSELGNLTQLTGLWLGQNQLSGEIPRELGELTQLTGLWLGANQLSGEIPRELGELTQLTELWLGANQLSGEIPRELGKLTQLTELGLHANELSGEIPRELGELTQLTGLLLHANQLSGEIPRELGNLTQLTRLWLHENRLSGEIPRELGELTQLTRLWLHENRLSGEIPRELGELTQLTELGLHANQLSGEIPRELGRLTELTRLELRANQLSGEIPPELAQLSELRNISLGDNEYLQGGRAHLFNLDLTGLSGTDFARLAEPMSVPQREATFGDEKPAAATSAEEEEEPRAHERATLRIVSIHPIELYDHKISDCVAKMFAPSEDENETQKCGRKLHVCSKAVPFNLELLTDLNMGPSHTFTGPTRHIAGHMVEECALAIGTVLCFVYHSTTGIATSHPADTSLYERIQWAISISESPPQWVRDALPYNSLGALYRAAWMWMYQRYIWKQWAPESAVVTPESGASRPSPTIPGFAGRNERMIEERLWTELQSNSGLANVVELIRRDHPRVFTFSALQIESGSDGTWPEVGESDGDGPEERQSLDHQWREHFSTTAYALDLLNTLADGVHLSKSALRELGDDSVYPTLQQLHLGLRELMSDEALENPAASLSGPRFEQVTRGIVDGLSRLDLEQVRRHLAKHQPLRAREEREVQPEWLDVQDGDDHLFVQAGPDSVIITTAKRDHIDEIVAMEIALQSGWNSFARASGRVLEAHEPDTATPGDAASESGAGEGTKDGPAEQRRQADDQAHERESAPSGDAVGESDIGRASQNSQAEQHRAVRRWGPTLIAWLRPQADDQLDPSAEEDAILDAMSDQLLRVTRWRAQISGWRRVAFERLREASGLDQNIDAFYRASREAVERTEMRREKVRADQQRKFQAAVTLAALALAAVVLGEIAISIGGAENETEKAVSNAAAWIVGLGLVLIAWLIAQSLSDRPSSVSRGVGWVWERTSENIAALLLVGLVAAFLYETLGGGPAQGAPEWVGRGVASLGVAMAFGLALQAWRERQPWIVSGLLVGTVAFGALWWSAPEFLDGSPFWRVDGLFWPVWTGAVTVAVGVLMVLALEFVWRTIRLPAKTQTRQQ